ncbi:MAG: hypothetical protein ACP5D7_13830 [Limnospira sp.]
MRWKKRCTGELQESNERLQQINSQLQRTLKEIRLLNEMSDRLQACYTREQAYAIVSLYMEQLFPHLDGGVFAISESKNFLEEMSSWGEGSSIQKLFPYPAVVEEAIARLIPWVIEYRCDADVDPRWTAVKLLEYRDDALPKFPTTEEESRHL